MRQPSLIGLSVYRCLFHRARPGRSGIREGAQCTLGEREKGTWGYGKRTKSVATKERTPTKSEAKYSFSLFISHASHPNPTAIIAKAVECIIITCFQAYNLRVIYFHSHRQFHFLYLQQNKIV